MRTKVAASKRQEFVELSVKQLQGQERKHNDPDVLQAARRATLGITVVDIPIGLPQRGPRSADIEARKILEDRGCCVFPAPLRSLLDCDGQESMSAKRVAIDGKKVNRQMAAIVPKITEVDRALNRRLQLRIREGHPEVSFACMNRGNAVPEKKRTPQGREVRLLLLRNFFPDVDTWVARFPACKQDVIDAYAMLWTALRVRTKQAQYLPADCIQRDHRGLKMEITY